MRRSVAVFGFSALAAVTAALTLLLAGVFGGEAATASKRSAPVKKASAHVLASRTVTGFLSAIRRHDYATACSHMLRPTGCPQALASAGAAVSTFGVVGATTVGNHALVVAKADGIEGEFALVRQEGRWLIDRLGLADGSAAAAAGA
jgi:hypothetical protein